MTRTIKFRAWDGKKMVYLAPLEVENENRGLICAGEIDLKPEAVMQFTGLHDKNGKEIYEGDVVISDLHDDPKKPRIVEWSEANQGFRPVMYHNATEVIGNVWENPELISKEV